MSYEYETILYVGLVQTVGCKSKTQVDNPTICRKLYVKFLVLLLLS